MVVADSILQPLPGAVWYALPIATFWFSLAFWKTPTGAWPLSKTSGWWLKLVLTFWRLSRTDNYWWWAMLTAFIGLFTSGNGLFILPLALFVILLQKRWKWHLSGSYSVS